MSRVARAFSLLLLLTVAVVLLLAVAAPWFVDREDLARRIEAAAFDATGQTIHIDGIPRLRLLPRPLVEMGPVRQAAQSASAESVTRAERILVRVRPLPMLIGRLELASLRIDGLRIPRLQPGSASAGGFASQSRDAREPDVPSAALPVWTRLPMRAVGVYAEQVLLDYPAGEGGIAWSLLRPDAGITSLGGMARLDAVIDVDAEAPSLQAELHLSAGIEPWRARTIEPPAAPPVDNAKVSTQMPPQAAPVIGIRGLRLTASGLRLGEGHELPLQLDSDLDYLPEQGRVRLSRLVVASGSMRMTLRGADSSTAPNGLPAPLHFQLHEVDLRAWLDTNGFGPVRGLSSTFRCVAAEGMAALAADSLTLSRVSLHLDGAEIVGGARLTAAPVPALDLALAVDSIDLDPYLAAADVTGGTADLHADAAAAVALAPHCEPAPAERTDWPRLPEHDDETSLQANLGAQLLRIGALDYRGVFVDALAEQGILSADIDVADFYAGSLAARLERDLRDAAAPRNTLRGHATGVDAGRLLPHLIGKAPITGIADVTAELAGSGADGLSIRRDLSGTLSLAIRDGRLTGLDIDELLAAAGAAPAEGQSVAQFSTLTATAAGTGGVFQSKDIAGRSPMLHLNGGGRFDAVAETLDLDLDAELVEPPQGGSLSALAGIRVPIRVTGSWQQPAWQADAGPALREAARRLLDQQLDRHRDSLKELEERTGIKGLEQGLKGLFGL